MNISTNLKSELINIHETGELDRLVKSSFSKIAPFWPLQNLIAVNPLQGFEDLPIEDAIKIGSAYFEQQDLPQEMAFINIQTIKWLQAYLDEGQATITMPLRQRGLYQSWRQLVVYDEKLHGNNKKELEFLRTLPNTAEQAIAEGLLHLGIAKEDREQFLTLLLTTLPGWASYIKYRSEWAGAATHVYDVTQADYLAMRIVTTSMRWPRGKQLLEWHKAARQNADNAVLKKIVSTEKLYRTKLLKALSSQTEQKPHTPEAQLVFCIDVRSEPFRKQLESTGDYQTLGFAGFFGVPIKVTDSITGNSYSSCPVLLQAQHEVIEAPCTPSGFLQEQQGYAFLTSIKRFYQSLKYTFSTPFTLVEALGCLSGTWMGLRTLSPRFAAKLNAYFLKTVRRTQDKEPCLDDIALEAQCGYAENALRMMGLTENFAPTIVFCGHGSSTQNNAYATALDCGACGGRHGASNAKVLAAIMNRVEVRSYLAKKNIHIPARTRFIAAEHNTTTDEVKLYCYPRIEEIKKLKRDLECARELNCAARLKKMQQANGNQQDAQQRAEDWAQVRPEWGLARNAAFIVAPRDLTSTLDLDGRCFMHSYDYKKDPQGIFLTIILTAPMVVAEWINTQYLFSSINNVAYGGGSKITKNITGKLGVMQGNASDLMTGLPLQSLHHSDTDLYHEPQRLMVVVLAPQHRLDQIIQDQPILQKLFGNGWVQLAMIDPDSKHIYLLQRDFSWQEEKI